MANAVQTVGARLRKSRRRRRPSSRACVDKQTNGGQLTTAVAGRHIAAATARAVVHTALAQDTEDRYQ